MALIQENPDAPVELEEVPCNYCGATEADLVLTHRDPLGTLPGRFSVVACRKCGLQRTNPRPTAAAVAKAYPDGYEPHTRDDDPAAPPTGALRWLLVNYRNYPLGKKAGALLRLLAWPWAKVRLRNRRVVGYLPYVGEGRLLDFGCGGGRYVAQMLAAGWKAEGIDMVPAAVDTGRKAGLTIHQGTLPGAPLPKQHYDLVTMWHVLEHVPSPMATLKAVSEVLKPGGRLAVVCPMSDSLAARWFGGAWYGTDMPRHLTHFTHVTLRRHLEAAGYVVEQTHAIRRPTFIRRSLATWAEDSEKPFYAHLARSHFVARLLSHMSLWLGQTSEAMFVVRRRENEG
jgi:2-polyprenyl-3-methyl-5-hydroxy-6-metoxy-1,4-benzoquinol methylase